MKNKKVHAEVLKVVTRDIQKEMKSLSSMKSASLLRKTTFEQLRSFRWDDLIQEMSEHTPTLLKFLQGCVVTKRRRSSSSRTYRVKDEGMYCFIHEVHQRVYNFAPSLNPPCNF